MRTYGEACPVAHALDAVGDRWSLLVVRELRLGPRRYSDLAAALPGIGPSVLSQRLRDLVDAGVLEQRGTGYGLTAWGVGLEPVFRALAAWGMASPTPRTGPISTDSVLLGLRTFFARTPGWDAVVEIRAGREVYRVVVVDGELRELSRGAPAQVPDAVLTGDDLTALAAGTDALDHAVASGTLTVTGDAAAVRRLVTSTARPPSQ
ncbi:winged helix-turn-helix transcriptional regulator [Pseudonocardia petroleophila]|uniref:winged helix-turn-helix transcriptional regulator n=1 Tax=Pseudonocardia petroleophila TaxID=37331 RepID=UPI001C8BDA25|nr:helix-turn-helix domain-containing protein [Pseudonocardia petroleophila]